MEQIIYEILKGILPAIITGLFTFFITKYTYNKNVPLDKMEYAYNEVYYPIYKFINVENNYKNIYLTKNSLKVYFDAYEKYIDLSTIRLYKELYNCETKTKEKSIYRKFINNIYDMNTYLRKRLGYLEPDIFQIYKYLTIEKKINFHIMIAFLVAIISLYIGIITEQWMESFIAIFLLCFIYFIISILIKFVVFMYYKFF